MKRLVLLAAMLPVLVFGAISGGWQGHILAGNPVTKKKQTLGVYVKLSQTGSTLTGTAGTQGKLVPIVNGSVSGNTVTFSIPEGARPGPTTAAAPPPGAATPPTPHSTFNLTVEGSNLVGTVTLFDHQQLPITLTPLK